MTPRQGSFPHKYRVGQVVLWGNGVYEYVKIMTLNPLHCDGGCPSYRVFRGDSDMRAYTGRFPHDCVSEDVLRPLTNSEKS